MEGGSRWRSVTHVLNERGDVGMPGRPVCARQKKQHVAAKRCESILENQSFPGCRSGMTKEVLREPVGSSTS